MRRLRLPVLLALSVAATLAVPAVAHADVTGPTIDPATLYNGGVPCSTSTAIPVGSLATQSIQALAADTQAHTGNLDYTFALWPTNDPSAEVDHQATGFDGFVATWNGAVLTDGVAYSWRVQASDSNGTSDWSQTCQFSYDYSQPAAPGVSSSNFPSGGWGEYNAPAQFTLTGTDPDLIGFQYGWGTLPANACSPSPINQLICPDPLSQPGTIAATNGSASVASTPPDTGPVTFHVRAIDRAGNVSATTDYATLNPPLVTDTPTIQGTPAVGQTLTGVVGNWLPVPTSQSFQWSANGVPLTGEAGLTHTVTTADLGKTITFSVTGSRTNVATTTVTSAGLLVPAGAFTGHPRPVITGSAVLNQVLTAHPGNWAPAPASFQYRWLRNGLPITGIPATKYAYRLTAADAGHVISVRVTASQAGYTSLSETSAATAAVLRVFTAPAPGVSGVRRFGQVLTAVPGKWTPAPIAFGYQWYLGSTPIRGATSARYAPPASVIGKPLSVAVTGVRAGYQSLVRHSAAFTIAPALFTVVPTPRIVGTARPGAVLTASMPATTPAAGYKYQWRSNGVVIVGQTATHYVVRPTDVDRRISVVVTAVRAGYVSVARASAPTAVVPGQAYPNCASLNAVYPHGVARIGVRYDLVRGVPTPFKGIPFFSTNLYNLNPARDGDHDGIACEKA